MPRRVGLSVVVLAALVASGVPGLCAQTRAICPLREVKAGQRAVAKTVFRGTKVESFNMEILGVLEKFDGTRSVILGRILDGPVVTRKSGVLQGMSGSPVYIKGRLAGAVALAWSFSKEPIAGITPIEEMLEAWEGKGASRGEASGGRDRLARPVRVGGRPIEHVRIAPRPERPDPPGVMTLTPLGGFVQTSGLNWRAAERLAELVAPYGVQVLQGPAGGTMESLRPPLVAGAAVGAQLVGGDFDITALGTVTLVERGRVLAFGHPLFGLGELDVPMTGGYVHDIMPSMVISEKVMSPTRVVGRVSRDMQSAIAGEVGAKADTLPVTIEVMDEEAGRTRRFRVEVARIREMLPALAAMAVLGAVDETRGRVARGSARVTVELEAEGRAPLRRGDYGYSDADAASAATMAVLRPLAMFIDGPLGKLRIQKLRVRVETEETRRTASIERLTLPQSRVRAGDEVSLGVTVRPYGQEPVELAVRVKLPGDLPRGTLRIVVCGGADANAARAEVGAPRPTPVSMDQLVERYLGEYSQRDLVAQAATPRAGAALLGEELPDLPRSALEALQAAHPTDLRPATSVIKVVTPTEWVLSGRQMVSVPLESATAPAGPPTPRPPSAPEEAPPGEGEGEGDEEEQGADWLTPQGRPTASAETGLVATRLGAGKGAEEPQAAAPAKKEEEAKPLTRAPQAWVHQTRSDHARARVNGLVVAENGRLSLGLTQSDFGGIPADVIWGLAAREGAVYAGTGTKGVIYKVSGEGKAEGFFATGEMNVHAVAFDKEGNLYAATSPRGKLFRISPEGQGQVWYSSESEYLWCLVVGPEGTVYAGGGSPARVYAIRGAGGGKVLAELPAANVLALVRTEAGDLYAGTSGSGVVYRVGPEGTVRSVCQVPGGEAGALALDGKGNVYAAGASGSILQIPPDGVPRLHSQVDERMVYGLAALPGDDLVVATGPGGMLLRVGADGRPATVFRPETGLATALAVADGAVYLGSSGPSVVRRFGPEQAASGTLESPVLEAGRPARWGRVEWTAEAPEGTEVKAETRSGDTASPDEHWSEWTPAPGGTVASPAASRLQYRLTLTAKEPNLNPRVYQVRVSYEPANQGPTVKLKAPAGGDRLAKKQTIKWEGRDPDKDSLSYDLTVSPDLGASWHELAKGIAELKYEWDTTPTSDGRRLLRVKASDAQSQPRDPREGEDSVVVWVDNTPPEVLLFRSTISVGEDRRARVGGMVSDKLSPIRSVEYRVGSGPWRSVAITAIETLVSDLSVVTEELKAGRHTVEVRAFDAAGNMASDKVEVKVEETAKVVGEGKPGG